MSYKSMPYMTNIFTHQININDPVIIPWKGKTFNQISSLITFNGPIRGTPLSVQQLRRALPLKIYRREMANNRTNNLNCGYRKSSSIDNFDMPGSTVVNSKSTLGALGFNSTVDFNYVNNNTEHPCNIKNCISSPVDNAKRRVRSAGMIQRKYNVNKNNDTYCTGTDQYLKSRNLSFSQNQYNYLRQGYASLKPGGPQTASNIYSVGGISHCNQPTISQALGNNTIQYYWYTSPPGTPVGTPWTAVIPDGVYTVENLNTAFKNAMFNNATYITNSTTLAQVYPLNIAFDNFTGQVMLQSYNLNAYVGSTPTYYDSNGQTPLINVITANIANDSVGNFLPYFIIPPGISNVIGFNAQSYPPTSVGGIKSSTPNYQIESNKTPIISSNYVRLNYKPSNSKFAVQGAVSSSALILRKKYDSVTTSANLLRTPFGNACANAMAYGVSENPYTLKTQVGFPLTKTPVIKPDGTLRCLGN
jgi:hypothetical protein